MALSALILFNGLAFAWLTRSPVGSDKRPGISISGYRPHDGKADILASRRSVTLRSSAEIAPTLIANGVTSDIADSAARLVSKGLENKPGNIRAVLTLQPRGDAATLLQLDASVADGSGLILRAGKNGALASTPVAASLSTAIVVRAGEIDKNSFYTSALAVGVLDSLIPEFARAFTYDFDFQREISPGDVFEAAFERTINAAGEPAGPSRLIYVSLTTPAKARALYRFQPAGEEAGWFDGNGHSVVRALMRTPIDGAHVTSSFGYRVHPILGYRKLHRGTDFAAPVGTPIFAAGDGIVEWAAEKGAAGNLVVIRHTNGWQTLYMHTSAFGPGIRQGVTVHQGQLIAAVGTTGRSTGPHLHYEVRVKGEPIDPQSIDIEEGRTLTGDELVKFVKERDRIDVARARYAG